MYDGGWCLSGLGCCTCLFGKAFSREKAIFKQDLLELLLYEEDIDAGSLVFEALPGVAVPAKSACHSGRCFHRPDGDSKNEDMAAETPGSACLGFGMSRCSSRLGTSGIL